MDIKKLLTKWQLWLFVGLTAVCIGLLVFGVFTHKEAGLTRSEITWEKSKFPLTVSTKAYEGSNAEASSAVQAAVKAVNSRLGFQALRNVSGVASADVQVTVGVPQDSTNNTTTSGYALALKDAGGFFRANISQTDPSHWSNCAIETSNTGIITILDLVLQHELGHCLGLAHDDFNSSIMYPVQSEYDGLPPTFTDSDKKILRGLYAN